MMSFLTMLRLLAALHLHILIHALPFFRVPGTGFDTLQLDQDSDAKFSTATHQIPTGPDAGIPSVPIPGWNYRVADGKDSENMGDDIQSPVGSTFNGTCDQLVLGGKGRNGDTSLSGTCMDDDGIWWQTSLNLNLCFGNDNGKLIYKSE